MDLIATIERCCPVVGDAPLGAKDAERIATAFKVIADPARLRLLSLIAAAGECCVCDMTAPLRLSQPTISHHLKVMHEAGLLAREKRGTWAYYSIVPEALAILRDVLTPAR
jgi:ArsR family transcriptional regulator